MRTFELRVLVSPTVYSHKKRCEENSNFHLHVHRGLCPRRIDGEFDVLNSEGSFRTRNAIFVRDVTINCVCTSAVNFCLRGTRVYSMRTFELRVLVSPTVYSHKKRCEENSNFHLHVHRGLCPRRIDGGKKYVLRKFGAKFSKHILFSRIGLEPRKAVSKRRR